MDIVDKIMGLTTWVIPVLLAITLHEAAHGYAANALGDPTAKRMGRLSLNPAVHIDPFGTIALPLILYFLSSFIFGYAKPVPVDTRNLRNPKRDMMWVSLAGPGANMALAITGAFLVQFVGYLPDFISQWVEANLQVLIALNLVLACLNMLPIPPLDGGRVAVGLLPYRQAHKLASLEPYGIFILVTLIFIVPMLTGTLGYTIDPGYYLIWLPAEFLYGLLMG